MAANGQIGIREALASAALRKLTAAQLVSMCGDLLAVFAVFSVVSFRMHGTAAQVSGIMIAYMLPQALVGPLAGVFVDRWDVKTTMIASDLLRVPLVVCLVYSTNILQIYGLMMLLSAISAFFMPAQTIAMRTIVPVNALMAANAVMMQVMQITQIATPGMAGLLIGHAGAAACFWLDSASFLFSAGVVFTIAIDPKGIVPAARKMSSTLADLTFGARYILTRRTLAFIVLAIAAGSFAVTFYGSLISVYVRDVLHGSTGLYGLLGTLAAGGTILGTQQVAGFGRSFSKEQLIVSGLFGCAFAFLLLAVFGNVPLTVIATAGMGFAVALVVIPGHTFMQSETPVEMLGRISGSVRSVVGLVQIAGLGFAGSFAQAAGAGNSYFVVSVLLALMAIGGSIVVPDVYSFSRSTRR